MTIQEILQSKIKPKEKINSLADKIKNDKTALKELIESFEKFSDSEKGNCFSALTQIIKENPNYAENCLNFAIKHINSKIPRIKWEANEIIGYASKKFPKETAKIIPKIIENTKNEGTVAKWSAAFALTEIAKNNIKARKKLIPVFEEISKKEKQNGVKNMYLKTLKILQKM